jgi:PD-(D/E)XK endonuclease
MGQCKFSDTCTIRRAKAGGEARSPKRKGELAELVFVLKAASLGLGVCKPYGDSLAFDFVVTGGDRLLRIQVKSAFTSHRRGYLINLGVRGHGHGRRLYTADDIDFFAAYVVTHDAWYIIPIDAIAGRKHVRLYPAGTGKCDGGHFETFREAWHLITSAQQNSSANSASSAV